MQAISNKRAWDYAPLVNGHRELMAQVHLPQNSPEYLDAHWHALDTVFNEDEGCFLHYQGLFYPYQKMFLETQYWHWVRTYALAGAGTACEMQSGEPHGPRRGGILRPECHHMDYSICGQEHRFLNSLIIMCGNHHYQYHQESRYEFRGIPPLLLRGSSPGSLRCSWAKNHRGKVSPYARWALFEPGTLTKDGAPDPIVWLICDNCHEEVCRQPTFELLHPPHPPKVIQWRDSEADIFVDMDTCPPEVFAELMRRCIYSNTSGPFSLFGEWRLF